MAYPQPLPGEYRPFRAVNFCSNILTDVGAILSINGAPALLVGRGSRWPLVWLAGPISPSEGTWAPVVYGSKSANPGIQVRRDSAKREVRVVLDGITLVHAIAIRDDQAEINTIDLRPLGLGVFGDRRGISVGSNRLSENHITGASSGLDLSVSGIGLLGF